MDRLTLLGISLDRTLLARGPAIGDAVWRHRQYAQVLDHLWYVVYAQRRLGLEQAQLANNLIAIPTRSRTRLSFPMDAYRLAAGIIRRQPVDLVTAQDPFVTGLVGYWLKRRHGVPLNVTLFSSFFDNPQWLASSLEARALHRLGKFIVRRADTVRVESPIERERLLGMGIPPERVWTIPLLVDLARFQHGDGSPVRALFPGRRLVLYAGRLAAEKNLSVIVRAAPIVARTHPAALFLIAGDGPERPGLEALTRSLGTDAVRFVGVLTPADVPRYFAACEVFVLPSLYEGIPTVLIEAAAAARPIVTTPTRNVEDVVVAGESGFVVDATPEAFAERIGFLLAHPEDGRAMGTRGQQRILRKYAPAGVLSDLVRMWGETVSRGVALPSA